jgi:hypothetical protein
MTGSEPSIWTDVPFLLLPLFSRCGLCVMLSPLPQQQQLLQKEANVFAFMLPRSNLNR